MPQSIFSGMRLSLLDSVRIVMEILATIANQTRMGAITGSHPKITPDCVEYPKFFQLCPAGPRTGADEQRLSSLHTQPQN